MGQSTTLSGRVINKHVIRMTSKGLDGDYGFSKHIIAGDTDSCYFTMADVLPVGSGVDEAVRLADGLCYSVNNSMAAFVSKSFLVPETRNAVSVGRETVCSRGLFQKGKKKYALAIADKEGMRERALKVVGMDVKRTEIPAPVRAFLKECVHAVTMDGEGKQQITDRVSNFRKSFRAMDPWALGRQTNVSNIERGTKLRIAYEANRIPNPRLHYAMVAADNTNRYIVFFEEKNMDVIRDGTKVLVFDLMSDPVNNPLELDSVALPVGSTRVPDWFKAFPLNIKSMEEKLLDKKLTLIFSSIGWKFESDGMDVVKVADPFS